MRVANGGLEVICASTFGPRVLGCRRAGGANLLGHFPERLTRTTLGDWRPWGGHRLWAAPEGMPGSYAPDDQPVTIGEIDGGVVLQQRADASGLTKTLTVRLGAADTVRLDHTVRNDGSWPIEIAAWALTVMAPGGTAVLPQPVFRPHGDVLRPGRVIAVWPFTDMADPRWRFGSRLIQARPDPQRRSPQKIGVFNEREWSACVWPDAVLIKRAVCDVHGRYPDLGVNHEIYMEGDYLELETLGTLARLEPGEATLHREEWRVCEPVPADVREDERSFHECLSELSMFTGGGRGAC